MADRERVARVRAGDAAALEEIFRMYARPLCAFAHRYVRSRETASELVQDVFLAIWRDRERWEIHESLKAYLYRATRNRALDHLKHAAVERRWMEESEREEQVGGASAPVPPSEMVETRDLSAALERVLDEFPERRRLVFLLRFREGMSYAEVAQLMGTSVKTVENQVNRALRVLRAKLGEWG